LVAERKSRFFALSAAVETVFTCVFFLDIFTPFYLQSGVARLRNNFIIKTDINELQNVFIF